MRRSITVIVLALSLMAGAAHAAIYKCEVNGKTVMTDKPCAANAEPVTVREPNSMDAPTAAAKKLAKEHDRRIAQDKKERDREDAAWVKQQDESTQKQERARNGVVERKAVRGMSASQLRLALGEPDSISRTDTSKGATERWEYTLDSGAKQTVVLSNGEVSAVSTQGKKKKKHK